MAAAPFLAAGAALVASAMPDALPAAADGARAPSGGVGGAAPPVALAASYTADIWANAHGGIRRGVRYLDNLSVSADADLDRLIGLRHGRAYASLLYKMMSRGVV